MKNTLWRKGKPTAKRRRIAVGFDELALPECEARVEHTYWTGQTRSAKLKLHCSNYC